MPLLNALNQYQSAPSPDTEGHLVITLKEILESPNYSPEALKRSLSQEQYNGLLFELPKSLQCKVMGIDPLDENLELGSDIYQERIRNSNTTEFLLENERCQPLNNNTLPSLLRLFRVYGITTLSLGNNSLGSSCVALLQGLSDIPTLTSIDLSNNSITDEIAISISNILKNNTIITSLNLTSNPIKPRGIIAITTALKHNKTLASLNLCQTQIGMHDNTKEAIASIAEMLRYNTRLTTLNLSANFLWDTEITPIAQALQYNRTLLTLYLNGNSMRVTDPSYSAFIEMLWTNFSLLEINLPHQITPTESLNKKLARNKKLNMSAVFRLALTELTGLHFIEPNITHKEIEKICQLFIKNKQLIQIIRDAFDSLPHNEKTFLKMSHGYLHFCLIERFSNSFTLEGAIIIDTAIHSLYHLHQLGYLPHDDGSYNPEYIQELDHLYHFLFQKSMDNTLNHQELHDIYISMLAIASLFPQEYGISYMRGTTDSLLELEAKKPGTTITFRGMLTEQGYDEFTKTSVYKTLIAPPLTAKCRAVGIPTPDIAKPATAPPSVAAQVGPT